MDKLHFLYKNTAPNSGLVYHLEFQTTEKPYSNMDHI